jgi:hypothetical protein
MINSFVSSIPPGTEIDPLKFWSDNAIHFPILATLAKKYLSVPASTAAVERMFSIAGHIFSIKRRRLGSQLFSLLVFFKVKRKPAILISDVCAV